MISCELGNIIYAMKWDCYHHGWVQYMMKGFIIDKPVAIFKLKNFKKR